MKSVHYIDIEKNEVLHVPGFFIVSCSPEYDLKTIIKPEEVRTEYLNFHKNKEDLVSKIIGIPRIEREVIDAITCFYNGGEKELAKSYALDVFDDVSIKAHENMSKENSMLLGLDNSFDGASGEVCDATDYEAFWWLRGEDANLDYSITKPDEWWTRGEEFELGN
jgi:hypothetical protein